MAKQTMLIVEDSLDQLRRYLELANDCGFDARAVSTLEDAKKHFETKQVDVLLTDVHLKTSQSGTFEGLELLSFVNEEYSNTLVLMMSSDPDVKTYEKAMALGASHFLRKPVLNAEELSIATSLAKSRKLLSAAGKKLYANKDIPKALLEKCEDGVVLPKHIRELATRIARHRRTSSIIMGETGSGKEEVAKLIHRKRCAVEGPIPFVAVNCATLNTDVATSLLFGHKKGAFTGADQTTNGFVGDADGGILFLDEVHTLSLECQQKLLRVLSDGTYQRVGETKPLRSEFQLLSASSSDLSEAVESGKLVEDLYMRLHGTNIVIPPLRERHDEIEILVALYFAKEKLGVPADEIKNIAEKCKGYRWRGNVRQLFRSLETLVVLAGGEVSEIRASDLSEGDDIIKSQDKKAKVMFSQLTGVSAESWEKVMKALTSDVPLEVAVDNYEKLIIQCALNRHDKVIDAVNGLAVSRSGFDVKRKKYSL